jgi:hypothetical protein
MDYSHYGDIAAIPFFAMLVFYFIRLKNKGILEYTLLLFSIGGFVADIIFTHQYVNRS